MLIKCKSLTPLPPTFKLKCQIPVHFSFQYLYQQNIPPNKKMYVTPKLFDIKKNVPPLEPPCLTFLCKLKGTEKGKGKLVPFIPSIYIPITSTPCPSFGSIITRVVG